MTATIDSYMTNRGFGFLKTSDGRSFFFHVSSFKSEGKPRPGAIVTFDITDPVRIGQRPQAINVCVVQESPFDLLAGGAQ